MLSLTERVREVMGMLETRPMDNTISACELKSCIPFYVIIIMVYFECIAMMKLNTKKHALNFTCTLKKRTMHASEY